MQLMIGYVTKNGGRRQETYDRICDQNGGAKAMYKFENLLKLKDLFLLPLSSSSSSSLFFLPLPPPFPPLSLFSLKVFAQSGSAQRGSTLCSSSPKWSLVAMSCASRLVPPMLRSYHGALFLCAAYDAGANYADGCCGPPATRFLALSSLLQVVFLLLPRPS